MVRKANYSRGRSRSNKFRERRDGDVMKLETTARDAQPEEEQRMLDYEKLAEMPLESLLYYILVGERRKRRAAAEG